MRVGLIGLKGHYGTVLEGLAEAGCELVAVCDDDEGVLASARGWPQAGAHLRTYTDFREMLDHETLDVVAESGTDDRRAEVICACAERGLHVLAEKPLAYDLEQLGRVREAVAASGVHLSMLLTMRFEPAYRLVREQVAAGAIGEVCQAAMQKSYRLGNRPAWQRNRATFSGIIPFIGIHGLDLIRWTSGREFARAAGFAANVGHPEMGGMEDSACVALELDNGGTAGLRLDYCRPAAAPTHGDDRLRLAGNKGVIESVACGAEVALITADEGPRVLELPEAPGQFANFVAAIRGDQACEVPAEDCYRITEVVLKIRDAARRGEMAVL
ncbi:MAG: Gfo/Idh/MocA family oxidoreductase [Armatimonadetes bacterium]|nr:Gfo/Idh/MocA family oxidoreductase [Armatimonadota bacterium]